MVFVGFVSAKEKEIVGVERVTKALLRVRPDSSSSVVRFFEPALASLGHETYCICLRESRQAVLNALKWLVENYDVRSTVHANMGGDSLTFGDEPALGSWEDDMASLNVLVELSNANNVRTHLAVGVLGGEGGRGLSPIYLAENLVELINDAYHGYYEPMGMC